MVVKFCAQVLAVAGSIFLRRLRKKSKKKILLVFYIAHLSRKTQEGAACTHILVQYGKKPNFFLFSFHAIAT